MAGFPGKRSRLPPQRSPARVKGSQGSRIVRRFGACRTQAPIGSDPLDFGIRLNRGRMLWPAPQAKALLHVRLARQMRGRRFAGVDMAVSDSKRRVALITGVNGQDGAYLAEYLLGLGYTVHGIKRRSSSFNTARVDHLYEDPHAGNVPFLLHYGDMTDSTNLIRLMQQIRPTEIYNLAAQSHVGVSFESPENGVVSFCGTSCTSPYNSEVDA